MFWLIDLKLFRYPAETLSEDDDDMAVYSGDGLSINMSPEFSSVCPEFNPSPGGPFSGLTPSMWPQDILHRLSSQVSKVFKVDFEKNNLF